MKLASRTFKRSDSSLSEISGAFGENGYTNKTIDSCVFTSTDIKSNLTSGGTTKLVIKTSDSKLDDTLSGITTASKQTQIAYATINIIGYMSIS